MRSANAVIGASANRQTIATRIADARTMRASVLRRRMRVARTTVQISPESEFLPQWSRASRNRPAMHQKATSQAGASRPRNERLSTLRCAWQQSWLMSIAGAGQKTDSASNATNAAAARRRLASIDIAPLSDLTHGIDHPVAIQRWRDFAGVRARGHDHGRRRLRQREWRGVHDPFVV